ncbi:LOW QUALITY PROTEIN: uncharacterized protein ACR2FA_007444 [Aphomia sociella]
MDRLNQLRGEGGSRDSTLDTTSPPSESYMTANESSSKYFSLSEEDSTFDISAIKDSSLPSSTVTSETTSDSDRLISNLSPIGKKSDLLDSYKIGKQIEAANILSGGVDIFDDNDNSYDGDELIIDDNVEMEEKSNSEVKGPESVQIKEGEGNIESTVVNAETATASKDTEVVLQIDGKNVDAIDIGNGLYLYRKEGQEELAAVQIIDDDQQQPSFKFLKVRENAEGNLEVYEEIQIEVPKEVPMKQGKSADKNVSHVPIKDINKVMSDHTCNKVAEKINKMSYNEESTSIRNDLENELNKDSPSDTKTEVNVNGKMMKFSEARKSPVIGSFTPMTYHSTPNKEGIPLTKTMVDQQLHPNRHSDNVKKTIEVHTDSSKQRSMDSHSRITKELFDENKSSQSTLSSIETENTQEINNKDTNQKIAIPTKKTEIETSKEKNISEDNVTSNVDNKSNEDDTSKQENSISSVTTIDKNEQHAVEKQTVAAVEKKVEEKEDEKNLTRTEIKSTQIQIKEDDKADSCMHSENFGNSNSSVAISTDNTVKENPSENVVNNVEKVDIESDNNVTKDNKKQDNKQDIKVTDKIREDKICDEPDHIEITQITENLLPQPDLNISQVKDIPVQISNTNYPHKEDVKCEPLIEELSKELKNPESSTKICSSESKFESKPITEISTPKIQNEVITTTDISKKVLDNVATVKPVNNKNIDVQAKSSTAVDSVKNVPNKTEMKVDCNTLNKDTKLTVSAFTNITQTKAEVIENKDTPTVNKTIPKPINNNHAAVPFGKWTEANRQEFLNKIKETKVPTNSSNGKQIKNSNDLNRRDVLKKIDSQRQSNIAIAKAPETSNIPKLSVKKETLIFINKMSSSHEVKPILNKKPSKQENISYSLKEIPDNTTVITVQKKESAQRKEINNQNLIDKTIEDIINRGFPKRSNPEEVSQEQTEHHSNNLDDIEMKMNKIHGIPFVEKSQHEVFSAPSKQTIKTYSKINKVPKLLPFVNKIQMKVAKDNIIDIDSEEEIIEHEPITGDIEPNKKNALIKSSTTEKYPLIETAKVNSDDSKKESIITEKDFDKFARRNSITYENCLQVNFDGTESHNVIQTVVEKDVGLKHNSKHENSDNKHVDDKTLSTQKRESLSNESNSQVKNIPVTAQFGLISENVCNKSYPSKVKMAYQSVMTAKRHLEKPFTIIEDKPVKVVYMDSNAEYIPTQLNVQGKELTSVTKPNPVVDTNALNSCDSMDSELMETIEEGKSQDEMKIKSKHQRKQVLTPVETPELELIEPEDLGIEVSPKKKRKTEESKTEKNIKTLVPKKSYLLGRSTITDEKEMQVTKPFDTQNPLTKNLLKDHSNQHEPHPSHKDTASAIDHLVKAAALIETQSKNIKNTIININNSDSQQNTPVKRGRGRPRKYPLPEGETDKNKTISPQKKLRLIDAKGEKPITNVDEDGSSGDEIIKENWTMGKINENIVCPICSKLFRSENVVFKHVKHCTGPSPNRSDSDKRRRSRQSQNSETLDSEDDEIETESITSQEEAEEVPKKRESKDKDYLSSKYTLSKEDIIVIEDTPVKEKIEKREVKQETRKVTKTKCSDKVNNLVCEFCGKTFRQLSYLVSHKLQHSKDDLKKSKTDGQPFKSVFSCEVCKKEFRKLHHLVQHRIIHNPTSNMTARLSRKNSFERNETKIDKSETDQISSKQTEDPSAGFRCEPCDKSFRKLHHLVEHRETHDGINRQKSTSTAQDTNEKSVPPPQCDICKKTFRKLHHFIEHKEQHLETDSDKLDDKNVKSSLSTKDIIHECSLCYMVFPNEHSLNKHTIICQRKKKQSVAKQLKQVENNESIEESADDVKQEENIFEDNSDVDAVAEEKLSDKDTTQEEKSIDNIVVEPIGTIKKTECPSPAKQEEPKIESKIIEKKYENNTKKLEVATKTLREPPKILTQNTKIEEKEAKTHNAPKKKLLKEKVETTVMKRQKTANAALPIIEESKLVESSDDDEIRYMLNPNFKNDDTSEGKIFMKVRAKKRNSLQIERPNSKDLVKRRISLQHPPKVPRLKTKVENKIVPTHTATLVKSAAKHSTLDPVPSTDSDDSDIKYSFPKTIVEKTPKSVSRDSSKDEKKAKRKTIEEKRKSLSVIAKRKSLGKVIPAKLVKSSPLKTIKRRTTEVEHRCDCGQLFGSAALLSRHTTVAHTPPRIRRRRSPPPEIDTKTVVKSAANKSSVTAKTRKSVDLRKSSVKSDSSNPNTKPTKVTRKSSGNKGDTKTPSRKSLKSGEESVKSSVSSAKLRRTAAHRGVPVPEKMRKLMEKSKK